MKTILSIFIALLPDLFFVVAVFDMYLKANNKKFVFGADSAFPMGSILAVREFPLDRVTLTVYNLVSSSEDFIGFEFSVGHGPFIKCSSIKFRNDQKLELIEKLGAVLERSKISICGVQVEREVPCMDVVTLGASSKNPLVWVELHYPKVTADHCPFNATFYVKDIEKLISIIKSTS